MSDEILTAELKDYPGYVIYSDGKIWSSKSNKFLKPKTDKHGYFALGLGKKCIRKYVFVHRLVAMAFIPNPENKPVVNHMDGDKQNNCKNNLEWVTSKENSIHAYETGLLSIGEDMTGSKLTFEKVSEIKLKILNGYYDAELGREYGVCASVIAKIRNNKKWRHVPNPDISLRTGTERNSKIRSSRRKSFPPIINAKTKEVVCNGKGIVEFCKERGISTSRFYKMLRGEIKFARNWQLFEEKGEKSKENQK